MHVANIQALAPPLFDKICPVVSDGESCPASGAASYGLPSHRAFGLGISVGCLLSRLMSCTTTYHDCPQTLHFRDDITAALGVYTSARGCRSWAGSNVPSSFICSPDVCCYKVLEARPRGLVNQNLTLSPLGCTVDVSEPNQLRSVRYHTLCSTSTFGANERSADWREKLGKNLAPS